jgi:glycosyltransferase involved in cell wall biosynthesis
VLPSGAGETWGLVVNEAMCFNLPVIISDIVGCSTDIVKNGVNGFTYKSGSVEELSGCIKKLVENKSLVKDMGYESGRIIAGWDYNRYLKVLSQALKMVGRKEAVNAGQTG